MLGRRGLADSIHRRGAAETPGMGHIPEELAIFEDHHRHYSISNCNIENASQFDCVILSVPANIGKLNPKRPQ
jgi:hypothetical protein